MDEPNPYQSPATDAEVMASRYDPHSGPVDGVWRKGKLLVMHKLAPLPNICVRTGGTPDRRVTKKLQWHHPALILLLFVSILVYIIVALIVMKRATVEFPITQQWMSGRNRRLTIGVAVSLLGGLLFALGIYGLLSEAFSEAIFFTCIGSGFAIGIAGLIACTIVAPILRPTRITDTHVYFKGAHSNLLASLPPWPYD